MGAMKRCFIAVVVFVMVAAAWYAQRDTEIPHYLIMESDSISEFINATEELIKKQPHTLVVLDIDDTIYQSKTAIGTPSWFYGMVNKLRAHGVTRERAYKVVDAIDREIQPHIAVLAVEQILIDAVNDWQRRGIKVIALTSRTDNLSSITREQLKSVGIDLSDKTFSCVDEQWQRKDAYFSGGVLYVNELTKSQVLEHFLEKLKACGDNVNAIAHVDDQKKYVQQIHDLAQLRKLSFIGLVYGGAVNARQFDMQIATMQLFELEESLKTSLIPDDVRTVFSEQSKADL